jgi:alginate O-acetyltransferase complex protein AlgI
MVFSEPTFLFFFLPLVLAVYFLTPQRYKNCCLLLFSLVFYASGEDEFLIVLLGVVLFNYAAGFAIAAARTRSSARIALGVGVGLNLCTLIYFKYAYFLASTITGNEAVLDFTGRIHLPIGVSFYIFQALTYLIDLYRRSISLQRSLPSFALYVSLFPQLIAGPIVRYSEVEEELRNRTTTREDFAAGAQRFMIGLGKKVLIADPMGVLADRIFAVPLDGVSTGTAWLGVAAYTLQIFFDFSAYSDMAIGLGRIFGFKFPENFNYPYISQSITEFWRRWHMTLSRWFRDYLYIPLGGNRKGPFRTYFNLSVVFIICGLWHGASWNFAFWGAYHGFLLVIERIGFGAALARAPAAFRHLYVMVAVMIGWTAFRAETFEQTRVFLSRMFVPGAGGVAASFPVERFLDPYILLTMMIGVVLSTPAHRYLFAGVRSLGWRFGPVTAAGGSAALLFVSVVAAAAADYSPFIYFRF